MAEDKKTDAPAKAPAKNDTKSTDTTANTPTTLVETGKPSDNVDPGESKGLDTIDRSAKDFVASGADAKAMVKDGDAPSGDVTRNETESVDKALAKDNIENLASGNSNHNTLAGVNPVAVEQADRPDYNPQRRPSSRANAMSATGEGPREMAERVDAKKEAPTNAEITTERRVEANDQREEPLTGFQSPYLGEN